MQIRRLSFPLSSTVRARENAYAKGAEVGIDIFIYRPLLRRAAGIMKDADFAACGIEFLREI